MVKINTPSQALQPTRAYQDTQQITETKLYRCISISHFFQNELFVRAQLFYTLPHPCSYYSLYFAVAVINLDSCSSSNLIFNPSFPFFCFSISASLIMIWLLLYSLPHYFAKHTIGFCVCKCGPWSTIHSQLLLHVLLLLLW